LLIGLGMGLSIRKGMRAWFWASGWYGIALLVLMGVTTPVLGSLFRYKMPLWPLFLPYLWLGMEFIGKKVRHAFGAYRPPRD